MLEVRPPVAAALAEGRPVVALESAFLTHGLPAPHNLEAARRMLDETRRCGALPAMIAVADGRLVVGLDDGEVESLAAAEEVAKVSRRDLGPILAAGRRGATTVAATLTAAAAAGIRVLATGGIGGVHRDARDVSADLPQISRTRTAVVCSGAKAVLDLRRTLETLETLGVPVVGYGTDELPAFYARRSGLPLSHRVDNAAAAAAAIAAHWRVEPGGLVLAVPPPEESALTREELGRLVDGALAEAEESGVSGAAATPFLLARVAASSSGRSVAVNVALLANNAAVAGRVARALVEARAAGTFPGPAR